MGGKVTKKIAHWLLKVFLILLALDLLLVILVFIPPVQNLIVHQVTNFLSEKCESPVEISKIYITPGFKLVAKQVVISDDHRNDMINIERIDAKINKLSFSPFTLGFNNLSLENPKVIIRKYKGNESVNIAMWARKLSNPDKTGSGFLLTAKRLDLHKAFFVLINDDSRFLFDTSNYPSIDYAFLELKDIDFFTSDFRIEKSDISAHIEKLSFQQYSGFELKNLEGDFVINSHNLAFKNARFLTANSDLNMDFAFHYNSWKSYSDFVDSVNFDVNLKPSKVSMKDVSCFVPSFQGMDEQFLLSGDVSGPINLFCLDNISLRYGMSSFINGDFSLSNITNFNDALFDVNISEGNIGFWELADFTLPNGQFLSLPTAIQRLGNAALKAEFSGDFANFIANLELVSDVGNCSTLITSQERKGKSVLNADLTVNNFNLGKLLNQRQLLGYVSLKGNMKGIMPSPKVDKKCLNSLMANLKGELSRFDLCGYPVHDILFDGIYKNKNYNGQIQSLDSNLNFTFDGLVDLTRSVPNFKSQITLNRFMPGEILENYPKVDSASATGFDKLILFAQQNPSFSISFDSFEFNITGERLEGLNGYAGIDGITLKNNNKTMKSDFLRFTAINTASGLHHFILASTILNAKMATNYPVHAIVDSLILVVHQYFPNLIPQKEMMPKQEKFIEPEPLNDERYLRFNMETFNTYALTNLLFPDVFIARESRVNINLSSIKGMDSLSIAIPRFTIRNKLRVLNLSAVGKENDNHQLRLDFKSDSLLVYQKKKPIPFKNINLSTVTQLNLIHFDLTWINPGEKHDSLSVLNGLINASDKNNIMLKFDNSILFVNDMAWHINEDNKITFGDNFIDFSNLSFYNDLSNIQIDGIFSKRNGDKLKCNIHNLDISLANLFLENLSFSGDLSATVELTNVNNNRFVYGKLFATDFVFNDESFDNLFLIAGLYEDGVVGFNGGLFKRDKPIESSIVDHYNLENYRSEKIKLANLDGHFNYKTKKLLVSANIDTLHVGFLSPFLASFADHISGTASGKLNFIATPDSTYFDGRVWAKNLSLGIAPLGTSYNIVNQAIDFDYKGITFDKIALSDHDGNSAVLDGYIHHNKFKDFKLDLKIMTDRLMALNTPKTPNAAFYGKGYVSGTISIFGDTQILYFKGDNLVTLSGSKLFFPVQSSEQVAESGNIIFKTNMVNQDTSMVIMKDQSTHLDFDFTFDVTKDAEVEIDLYSVGGVLKGRTNGRLKLTYNDLTDLNLYGNLSMESGVFLLSLKNVLNTKFQIVPGGLISFDGPLSDFVVSIKAFYGAKTSLKSIINQEDVNSSLSNTQVNAYIHLNGELMKSPAISFSFELPNSDQNVQNLFFTAIDTADQYNVSKEFFSFIFTQNFLPNDISGESGTDPLASSGYGFLTNMINNMISQQLKGGDIGVIFEGDQQSTRYGINANVPFLNDRMIFETNLGFYDNNSQNTSNSAMPFFGDFSLEYLITEDGNWRVKVYNFNDQYSDNVSSYQTISGVGLALIFNQEFNVGKDFIKPKSALKPQKKSDSSFINSSNYE